MNKQRAILIALVSCCISVLAFIGCETQTTVTQEELVERGEYLVMVADCNICHTPKIQGPGGMPLPDTTRIFAGHPEGTPYPTWSPQDLQQRNALTLSNPGFTAWAGPWGVSFAANLTPDEETGIGEWTEETFMQAMHTGKHQGQPNGRDILPPMPWQNLDQMTETDLKAIWVYMRSLPPVKNQVPTPVPPPGAPKGE